ncbi:hypothetical protein [uncultured Methanoculleus sp.]|jgi:hypothetical protein|uniref:Glycosyltransferase RgtA/B/C/D-like domain-containing protein n=1 Tax=Methanoculleus palmolei TaxID=72612 RepID=A0ABD8AAV5_9EURY|nr:hypothetical protein R6Y95_04670 [Methanoculleus palmolei]
MYAVPILSGFYYISHYAVNVPYWDQWGTIVPWTIEWYEGTFNYSSIFEPQNDSRPIITNVLMLFVSIITALDVKTMFFVGYILFLICILFIIYFVKRDIGIDSLTLALLAPVLFYVLNLYYLSRFITNLGALNYPILILTALASLYLLYESKKSNLCFLCSIGMGVACTFSFAAGLTIWFAGFVQLLLQSMHRKWEKIVIWATSAASLFYVYFILLDFRTEGLHSTDAYGSFIDTILHYPLNKFLCFMGTLGAEIVHDGQVALFFGLIILSITIVLIYINRKSLQLDQYAKWYGLLVFGTLTSLEVALTRSGALEYIGTPETVFFIPALRHSLAIFLPIICIYILSIFYLKDSVEQKKTTDRISSDFKSFLQAREHKNLFLLGIIFTLLICSVVLHAMPGITLGETNHGQQIVNQYNLQNYANVSDEKFKTLCWDPQIVRSQAAKLEQYNLSIFANPDPEPHLVRFYWLEPDAKSASGGDVLEDSYYKKHANLRIGSESMPAIFEHPQGATGTTIVYDGINIRNGSHLKFSIGLDEDVWNQQGCDGVTFEIYLHDPILNVTHNVFSKTIDPAHAVDDRRWQHFETPLEMYVGKSVNVQYVTRPNGNTSYDWAWWGDPKIVW